MAPPPGSPRARAPQPRAAAVAAAARPSAGRAHPRSACRALSARLTSSATGRARLLVLTRRLGWRRRLRWRHALVERRRRGRLRRRVRGARGGRRRLLGRWGGRRRRRRRQRREGEGRGQGPHRTHGRGRRRPGHQQPRPRPGSRRWPRLEAPFGAREAQLTQRRGVRSGRHGAPQGPAPAAPFRRRRRFLLRESSGGRGPDCAAAERAEPVLSRGGRRRRRETHKEGGERAPRGRTGGDGAGAWIGPGRGKGSKSAASDWRSLSPSRCALGLAGPLGQARKWRLSLESWEVSQRALHLLLRELSSESRKAGIGWGKLCDV